MLAFFGLSDGKQWFPLALSASAPWIALAINRATRGELGFERWIRDDNPRWKRVIPRFWDFATYPAIALFAIAYLDFNPVDLAPFVVIPLLVGSALAAAFFALVAWIPPKRRRDWSDIIPGTFGFWGYVFGCMSILNGMLPQPPPTQFQPRIISKYIEGGRSHARMFALGPWGPFDDDEVQGTLIMYDQLNPGDSICMLLHPGAFGFAWYEIAPWTAQDGDPHCYAGGAAEARAHPRRLPPSGPSSCEGDEVSAATCT